MQSPAITVDIEESMQRALILMTDHQIGVLPVLDQGKLVGVITDMDLRRAAPPQVALMEWEDVLAHMEPVSVRDIMKPDPITVPPDFTVEEAAVILRLNDISGCPVLSHQGELVGIITKNDLFSALISVTGFTGKGFQFGFIVEDRTGSIQEVTDLIRKYNARLVSIMTSYERAPEGYRFLFVRAFNVNRDRLAHLKKDLDATAQILYVIDHRDGIRSISGEYYSGGRN